MKRIEIGDWIIIVLSLALIVSTTLLFRSVGGEPEIHVRSGGKQWIYDLSVDRMATFSGPVGETTIEIKGGKVHVLSSDCRNKVCIAAGWISKTGQWIICLPNDVFVSIEGSFTEGEVDDTSF